MQQPLCHPLYHPSMSNPFTTGPVHILQGKLHSASFEVRKFGVPGTLEATCGSQTVNLIHQCLRGSHYLAIHHRNDSGCIWAEGAQAGWGTRLRKSRKCCCGEVTWRGISQVQWAVAVWMNHTESRGHGWSEVMWSCRRGIEDMGRSCRCVLVDKLPSPTHLQTWAG